MCKILDDYKMNFETHHDIYLTAGQCWRMIYALNFYYKKKNKKKKNKKKNKKQKTNKKNKPKEFDVNTRAPRRARSYCLMGFCWGVLHDSLFLYLEFDMNKYLNWINIANGIGGFVINVIIIYLLAPYGILRCAAMILCSNLAFFLYWPFHTYSSQFVLVYFFVFVYIHIVPPSCMPHLLIFLKCSLAFVILPVSILLLFGKY